jgi:hypothetical protein
MRYTVTIDLGAFEHTNEKSSRGLAAWDRVACRFVCADL